MPHRVIHIQRRVIHMLSTPMVQKCSDDRLKYLLGLQISHHSLISLFFITHMGHTARLGQKSPHLSDLRGSFFARFGKIGLFPSLSLYALLFYVDIFQRQALGRACRLFPTHGRGGTDLWVGGFFKHIKHPPIILKPSF